MAFLQALGQLLWWDARQRRQPEDVQDHFADLHRLRRRPSLRLLTDERERGLHETRITMRSDILERDEGARKGAIGLEVTREVLWGSKDRGGDWRRGRRRDGRRRALKSLAFLRGPEEEASHAATLGVVATGTFGSGDW